MQKKESVSEIVSRNKISEVSVFKGVNILPRFMQKQIEKYEIYVILTIKKKKKDETRSRSLQARFPCIFTISWIPFEMETILHTNNV